MITKSLARGGLIAAIYVLLTWPLQQLAFGITILPGVPIQFRPAEALTVLPILFPEAIPGVFIGCLLANVISQFGMIDIVFGSLITLVAALVTWYTRRTVMAYLSPIIFNALLVSIYVAWFIAGEWFTTPWLIAYGQTALSIGLSQTLVIIGLGVPLVAWFRKNWGKEY
jgi:uncharacterized membrane protein